MLFPLVALLLAADPPYLTVGGEHPVMLARDGLLGRAETRPVLIDDADLGGKLQVSAIALADLMGPFPSGSDGLEVTCNDGFVAVLPLALVQNRDPAKPIGYLAIDRGDAPWPLSPRLADAGTYIGPFIVVWTLPPGTHVGREQWPYQVVKLSPSVPLANRYPKLTPQPSKDPAVGRGFEVFVQNCLPCHKLNGQGPAEVGPDLNVPHSPLEYFGRARFLGYVRDPQELHAWAGSKMPPFGKEVLSDAQLSDLASYFAERAKNR